MSTDSKQMIQDDCGVTDVVGTCPECGGVVLEGKQKFYCRNFTKHKCRFMFSKKYFKKWGEKRILNAKGMRALLNGDGLTLRDLATIKNGRMFDCSGFLIWIKQINRWGIDFVNTVWHG